MTKYLRWDGTNKRYEEVEGLPNGVDHDDDDRLLQYDWDTDTWYIGLKITSGTTEPTGPEVGDIWVDTTLVPENETLLWVSRWAKTLTMCDIGL